MAAAAHVPGLRDNGNGLLFSGYNRDGVVDANEFVWIGDTAMGAWGRTDEWDGTSGEQPRGVEADGHACEHPQEL